jgi:RIP metalloprotease RseP
MSYVLAAAGFAALIILHELGHFTAAKAVGMRVERFFLFFPPAIAKFRRGETEYGIGAIPLGGFVKITGMNPDEKLSAEVAPRAYYRMPVWKRIVVIAAGPAMNLLIAFVLLFGLAFGAQKLNDTVGEIVPARRRRRTSSRATGSWRSMARAFPTHPRTNAWRTLRGWSATTSARESRPAGVKPRRLWL